MSNFMQSIIQVNINYANLDANRRFSKILIDKPSQKYSILHQINYYWKKIVIIVKMHN